MENDAASSGAFSHQSDLLRLKDACAFQISMICPWYSSEIEVYTRKFRLQGCLLSIVGNVKREEINVS